MAKKKWKRKEFPMFTNLKWEVTEGYKSFVADQGAARFDVPREWVFEPGDSSVKFFDREPPDAQSALEATVFRLPLGVDWSGFPLAAQLTQATRDIAKQELERSEVTELPRDDLEIVWMESRYIDDEEHRQAFARYLLARRLPIQVFISFAYWPEDAARLVPVWEEMVRSLRLAEFIPAPFQEHPN